MTRLMLALALSASVGCASGPSEPSRPQMDALFLRLRTTHDRSEAEMLEVTIRHAWAHSGRDNVDRQMEQAATAIHAGDYDQALDTLDKVVAADPGFVEGWDQRAMVHYLRDEYTDAVSDIEHVLILEPRHFGALAGRAMMYLQLDKRSLALRDIQAALAIHPFLNERLLFPELQQQITRT